MKVRFFLALLPFLAACAADPVAYFPAKGAAGVNPDAEFVVIDCTTRHFNPLGWTPSTDF